MASILTTAKPIHPHPGLDRVKNATITARDFRLRFEFGADISSLVLPESGSSGKIATATDRDVAISLFLITASFAGQETSVEFHREDGRAGIDIVLHNGEEKRLDFSKINDAYIAFCLRVEEKKGEYDLPWDAFARLEGDRCLCYWKRSTGSFRLSIPRKPGPLKQLHDSFEMKIV